jgi:hypothetical protein
LASRIGNRRSNAWDKIAIVRQMVLPFAEQLPGGLVQAAGPAIVAQAFPQAQHVLFLRRGEVLHRGKRGQEALEKGHHRRHLGLLEHDLADPNGIRIAGTPPGQIAAMTGKPGQQFATHPGAQRSSGKVLGQGGEALRGLA